MTDAALEALRLHAAAFDAKRQRRAPRRAAAAGLAPAVRNPLYSLRIGALWRFFAQQRASFWLVCVFLFFEYVRPQQIYESISFIPWGNITISLAVVVFLMEGVRVRIGLPEYLLGAFTLVLLASSVTALRPDVAFDNLADWFVWVAVYILIANTVVTEGRFLVMALTYLMWNLKMSQSGVRSWAADGFAFRDWGIAGAPGWFSNSGEFAIQMCVFLPLVIAFWASLHRRWSLVWKLVFGAMAITAVMCIVGSSSRGALIALAAMALWMLAKSRYKVRGLVGIAALAALVWLTLPPEQLQRLRESGEDKTSTNRTVYWERGLDLMSDRPVLGIGYKNWVPWHEASFGRKAMPHNIFIEAGAEMGYLGLVSFLALIGGTLALNARTRRLARARGEAGRFVFDMAHALDAAMIGYLAGGFFVTVLFYPYFWINLAMTAALHNTARGMAATAGPAVAAPRRAAVA